MNWQNDHSKKLCFFMNFSFLTFIHEVRTDGDIEELYKKGMKKQFWSLNLRSKDLYWFTYLDSIFRLNPWYLRWLRIINEDWNALVNISHNEVRLHIQLQIYELLRRHFIKNGHEMTSKASITLKQTSFLTTFLTTEFSQVLLPQQTYVY